METQVIGLAAPVFFALIALELWIAKRRGHADTYSFHDTVSNISCGIGQQLVQLLVQGSLFASYLWVYQHAALRHMPTDALWSWLLLLVLIDLAYYAFHRASHRINLLWAAHAVHHQSQRYNLSVALRQSWLEGIFGWAFVLPLAVLGFEPLMLGAAKMIQTLYQFWIHTREIGRLGALEWMLTTPSHHRVHHGVNPQYIDRNYGGMFIIWDRLFGTFAEETEEPTYGTVKPLRSWNPLWANASHWVTMVRMARAARSSADWLMIWFKPPEWRPRALGGPVCVPPAEVPPAAYRTRVPRLLTSYIGLNFILVVAGTVGALVAYADLSPLELLVLGSIVLASLASWGGLAERRAWAGVLERLRLASAVAAFAWVVRDTGGRDLLVGTALLLAFVFWLWLRRGQQLAFAQAVPGESSQD